MYGPAVPDLDALTKLLQASRNRTLHLIGAAALILVLVSVEAVVKVITEPGGNDTKNLIVWGVGCAAFVLLARLWYRSRVNAIARLVAAVRDGASLYRCQVTSVFLRIIPLGHEVDLVAVDAARESRVHLAFGFWKLASANELVAMLEPHIKPGPPPGIPIKLRVPSRR